MSEAGTILALALGVVGVGLVVTLALGMPREAAWLPTLLGVAPLVGLLSSGVAAMIITIAGVGLRASAVAVVAAALALCAWLVRSRVPVRAWALRPPAGRRGAVAEALLLLATVPVAAAVLRLAAASGPQWDGWAIWGVKAQALSLAAGVDGPVFTDPFYVGAQQTYPLVLPALAATGARARGGYDPLLADVPAALALVLFALAAWGVLRTMIPGWAAALAGLGALGSWALVSNATDGYADALLACAVAFGMLCASAFVLTRSLLALALAAGALAVAPLIKSEGLSFALAAVLAVGAALASEHRSVRPLVPFAAVTLGPGLMWAAAVRDRESSLDLGELARPGELWSDRGRGVQAFGALLDALAQTALPALALGACGVTLAVLARRRAGAILVLAWSALALGALTLSYVVADTDIDWHLRWSADRVVLSVGLSLAVMGPLLAFDAWGRIGATRAALVGEASPERDS